MADVLAAYRKLKEAQAAADEMVAAARLEFGRAMYEARHRPPHLGPRITRDDISAKTEEEEAAEGTAGKGLKPERLRQIEKMYLDTLLAQQTG